MPLKGKANELVQVYNIGIWKVLEKEQNLSVMTTP